MSESQFEHQCLSNDGRGDSSERRPGDGHRRHSRAARKTGATVITERPGMLHIVAKNDVPVQRIAVARRHIETAIAHINDVAQTRVLEQAARNAAGIDELRLIVRALADIRDALRSCEWTSSAAPAKQAQAAGEHVD